MWDAKKNNPTLTNPNANGQVNYNLIANMYNPYNSGRTQNAQYGNFLNNQMTQKI